MANENDVKIKTLLEAIEAKKIEMGSKPKSQWKTNGQIGESKVNINTINSIEKCIYLCAEVLQQKSCYSEACLALGVQEKESTAIDLINDTIHDLKLKVSIIQWDLEKKKLSSMEEKLKDLRSQDLKTEDALADIKSNLGL